MKITETVERECCAQQDLKRYFGVLKDSSIDPIFFCRHCGELWIPPRRHHAFDEPEYRFERLFDGGAPKQVFEFLFRKGEGWIREDTSNRQGPY